MFEKLKMEGANDGGAAGGGGNANGNQGGAGGGSGAAGPNQAPNIADGGAANSGSGGMPVGDGGSGSGDGGAAGKSWLDSLPDDIKKDPSLQMFKEPSALAKSWVNAQKMIGADKVVIPGEGASDEERAAFFQKLGRPENADKYEIKLPDGAKIDDNFAKSFKEAAFKSGLTPSQVNGLANWYSGFEKQVVEGAKANQTNQLREEINSYVEELGGEDKYKAKVDHARVAVRELASPKLKEFLVSSGLGSHPQMIELFSNLYKMGAEGKVRDGTGVPFTNEDPVAIQNQITEVEAKLFNDVNNPSRSAWIEQRNKLYERLQAVRAGK